MTIQEDVETLRAIPLFAKIEPQKLKLLAFTSEHLKFFDGDFLCRQGEPGDSAFILLKGTADVIIDTPSGPVTVASLRDNDFVGEIAILCGVPRTASVKATTELTTLRINKETFFNLVQQFPQVAVQVMAELASRLHQTNMLLSQAREAQRGNVAH